MVCVGNEEELVPEVLMGKTSSHAHQTQLSPTCALFSLPPALLGKERNDDVALIALCKLVQMKAPFGAITNHFKDLIFFKAKDKPGILTCVFVLSSLKYTKLERFTAIDLVVKHIGYKKY